MSDQIPRTDRNNIEQNEREEQEELKKNNRKEKKKVGLIKQDDKNKTLMILVFVFWQKQSGLGCAELEEKIYVRKNGREVMAREMVYSLYIVTSTSN